MACHGEVGTPAMMIRTLWASLRSCSYGLPGLSSIAPIDKEQLTAHVQPMQSATSPRLVKLMDRLGHSVAVQRRQSRISRMKANRLENVVAHPCLRHTACACYFSTGRHSDQRTRCPGRAPSSAERRNTSLPPGPLATIMPSLTPNFIFRGARFATITTLRPTSCLGS